MKRLGMIIDMKHSLLKFPDSDMQVKINKCSPYTQVHTECRARKACMLGTAKIQAGTSKRVTITVQKAVDNHSEGIIQGWIFHNELILLTGLIELRELTTTEQQQYTKVQHFNDKMVTEIVIMNMSSGTVKLKHKSEVSEIVDMSEKEIDEAKVMDLINNNESHYKWVDEPTFSPEIELDSLLKIPFLGIVHNTYLEQKEKETRASKEQEKLRQKRMALLIKKQK